jgi:hypothetical protein
MMTQPSSDAVTEDTGGLPLFWILGRADQNDGRQSDLDYSGTMIEQLLLATGRR